MPHVDRVAEQDPVLQQLTADMVAEMIALYGGSVATWKLVPPHGTWLVLRADDGAALGCGGIIPLTVAEPSASPVQGEIKRVYVVPAARGRGLSRVLMHELVALAPTLGYEELWLETGLRQPGAIALYESLGWHRIEPYGPYADEESVCFGLHLTAAAP